MIIEIKNYLLNGKTILYPTDTVWGLGCDATNESAVKKIYQLKNREESKSLIILVASIEMLQKHVGNIPEKALEILKTSVKPTTIIYNNPKELAANAIAVDDTIAIRIPKDPFCIQLIKEFGKPIVSTSANVSGEPTPKSFSEISEAILKNVDYVVDLHQEKIAEKSSTILKIEGDDVIVIRE
ncbi:L-threonylcarbamoyladenylate synthase [Tenacibaculum sp. FZY0031]|uniref:L-threonylcarbamoyladenylate synthase n=1 Tax=Tenacibaculum sp. FZY0031 TaxID=3116648 RepID=UPI002ECB8938|nr:L-threonylcarbamoyladenylate synthase [Tenacibaculum sp. FZY0031]